MATTEERLAKLREKQAQLKAQEKKIIAQENAKARKARTKRLIEIGGAAESVLGRSFQDGDLQKFINFLKQQETNGNYYSKAMNDTNLQQFQLSELDKERAIAAKEREMSAQIQTAELKAATLAGKLEMMEKQIQELSYPKTKTVTKKNNA